MKNDMLANSMNDSFGQFPTLLKISSKMRSQLQNISFHLCGIY